MTPQDFIRKWKPVALNERQTAQEHFIDLCRLFDHGTPVELDPAGEFFSFEKGVSKSGGGDGFADVWKKGHFAWEYKKRKRDLDVALGQLVKYAAALENPPLHVVCDTLQFKIVTAWTNSVVVVHNIALEDLADPDKLKILRAVFHDPESLRPKQTRASLTREAADKFQTISDRLQHRNPDREAVAHFVNQLVFCFFADSVKLLPDGLLKKLLRTAEKRPHKSKDYFDKLFAEMENGGEFDLTEIAHFNGGLFDGRRALPLEHGEIQLLFAATSVDWSLIDPTIFGTLFERFLDPDKRAQIGAHYTDREKIMMIVEPVIACPLRNDAEEVRAQVAAIMKPVNEGVAETVGTRKKSTAFDKARVKAENVRDAFIDRLTKLRILDPACGSGNFLYLALQAVKDIEYRLILDCETLGLGMTPSRVGPEILHGIEINPFAAELARMTIWIGDIQWGLQNGVFHRPEPILRKLDAIECRDALLAKNNEGEWIEAQWPECDFIVGNPPFLGGKKLRDGLGDETVEALFAVYDGRVPREADLVVYWFVKAWENMKLNRVNRAGFVATNSIRGGANRKALEPIADEQAIFEAWSDEPWVVDGAAVRVSLIAFKYKALNQEMRLNGNGVNKINVDLTSAIADLTQAQKLCENTGLTFQGIKFGGPFEISQQLAHELLSEPLNPNGFHNSVVIKKWINGLDVLRRVKSKWCIDFPMNIDENSASLFERPYSAVKSATEKENDKRLKEKKRKLRQREQRTAEGWWIHQRPRNGLRSLVGGLKRYLVTTAIAKHRLFSFFSITQLPTGAVFAIARDDDTTFGILHSRFHEAWSLRLGTSLEDRPRYTPTTTFETFPFPEGLTPNIPAKDYASDPRAIRIAAAAKKLDDLRNSWLNPPDLVDIVPEVYPTPEMLAAGAKKIYPDCILPKNDEAAAKLKTRTLTNLYNERPQWLVNAHDELDRAVAAAYGWPEDISIDEALAKLLDLNLARAAAQGAPAPASAEPEEAELETED